MGRVPDLAFAGIRTLRAMAEFCETYQVTWMRNAGYSWARIASWARISPRPCTRSTPDMVSAPRTRRPGPNSTREAPPHPTRHRNERLRAGALGQGQATFGSRIMGDLRRPPAFR